MGTDLVRKSGTALLVLMACAAFCGLGLRSWAGEGQPSGGDPPVITTTRMADLAETVYEKGRQYGIERVLVVFDIDNTLLAMNQDLGSDQWFSWQNSMLDDPDGLENGLMVRDFNELLAYQQEFFFIGSMHPPESDTPKILAEIQSKGFDAIALTSRGPETRVATLRELEDNGMSFVDSAVGTDRCGTYLPSAESAARLFSSDDLRRFDLDSPDREISYASGVYMTAGLHKGAMLMLLLDHFGQHYRAVIFADDHERHCTAIWTALDQAFNHNADPEDDVDIATFEYTRELPRVTAFQSKKSHRKVNRAFKRYIKAKQKMFPHQFAPH